MTVAPGTSVGRYEIVAFIGAGAMGEVYRARDTRLGREVAIKLLPARFSADAERLRRFDIEARAAGALQHPNIVVLFDLGTHEGMPYVVSELLEGETLRELQDRARPPLRKGLEMATQIAHGLAAAHAQGIVHRDLKPENLFVTTDGRVKILDFGLAKLVRAEEGREGGSDSLAATMTQAGLIMGTAGYMAPEQVRGEAADRRSDMFAFGCVLYELLVGQRAFQRATPVETLTAILQDDPPKIPAELRAQAPTAMTLILRCLEKNPGERFESARDLAFALEACADTAGGEAPAGGGPAAALANSEITFKRLTFQRGNVLRARFTPDGHSVVYGGSWEGRPVEVFWMHLGSPEARAIGTPGTDVFAVSSTGELAVCLKRSMNNAFSSRGTLARMPLGGLVARPLLENAMEADWGPSGQIAVVREMDLVRLEYPAGRLLFETAGWVSHARVSRDGQRIAFIHHESPSDDAGNVLVVDLEGRVRALSEGWGTIRGLCWSADDQEVWFTAHREGAGRNLHSVTMDGRLRTLLAVPGQLCIQDVHPDGDALLTHSMERQAVVVKPPGESQSRDLSWLDWSLLRDLSSDGLLMLLLESGEGGGAGPNTWIRPTDGSPALRLGDGQGWQFSPDGMWVLTSMPSAVPGGQSRLVMLPTGVGEPREIPLGGLRCSAAQWLPEGRGVVVLGSEEGRARQLYRVPLDGSSKTPFGPEGPVAVAFFVSPDGKTVAARSGQAPYGLYSVEGGESRPIPGIHAREEVLPWTLSDDFVLVHMGGQMPARVDRINLDTGERTLWREISPPDPTGAFALRGFNFARDADAYGFTYVVQLDDLYLLKGLR